MKNPRQKTSISLIWMILMLSGAMFIFLSSPVTSEAAGWKAGTAAIVVTPEKPEWMAGYGDRNKPSEGKINDLYVKALALEDPEGNRVVITTADLIGVLMDFSNHVAKEIENRYGIPRKAILFNTSHNHSGPEVRAAHMPFYQSEESVKQINACTALMEKRYLEVISKAIENMKPAELMFSSVMPVPFAVSRRLPTPEGIAYRSTPSGYYTGGSRDDVVPVLKISAPDGSIKTILFGYACHPITLTGYKFCSEYPGFAQGYIEEAYPGATAMFMQGCAGELVPNARFQIEYAMGHGRALADAVKKALDGKQIPITGTLRCAYEEITLDLQPVDRKELEENLKSTNETDRRKAAAFLQKLNKGESIDTTLPCPLQVIRIGNELMIIGLSGEPVVDYAVRFKSEFLTQFTWVAGYCNHEFGYLPTWRILKEGGYEGGDSMRHMPYSGPFTETVEQKVVEGVRNLVKNVFE